MGAGPAGLTAAYELGKHGVPVTVLEKDERFVGGLAHDEAEYIEEVRPGDTDSTGRQTPVRLAG